MRSFQQIKQSFVNAFPICMNVPLKESLVITSWNFLLSKVQQRKITEPTFTCLKSTVKTLKKGVKYVQNQQEKHQIGQCHCRCYGVFIDNLEHISYF